MIRGVFFLLSCCNLYLCTLRASFHFHSINVLGSGLCSCCVSIWYFVIVCVSAALHFLFVFLMCGLKKNCLIGFSKIEITVDRLEKGKGEEHVRRESKLVFDTVYQKPCLVAMTRAAYRNAYMKMHEPKPRKKLHNNTTKWKENKKKTNRYLNLSSFNFILSVVSV